MKLIGVLCIQELHRSATCYFDNFLKYFSHFFVSMYVDHLLVCKVSAAS